MKRNEDNIYINNKNGERLNKDAYNVCCREERVATGTTLFRRKNLNFRFFRRRGTKRMSFKKASLICFICACALIYTLLSFTFISWLILVNNFFTVKN